MGRAIGGESGAYVEMETFEVFVDVLEQLPPMRLLDLFCGAGGAAMGYHLAGFDVVGVDLKPQPNYPFAFIQSDALTFPLGGFDVIHASPPCQLWSTKTRDKERHRDLISPLRPLLKATGIPYVIENVPGAPLVDPIRLCGSSFGRDVRRHRIFESSIPLVGLPCVHEWQKPRFRVYDHGRHYLSGTVPVFGTGGGKARAHWQRAMGIDWMTDDELREAIPSKFTEFIGAQIRAHIESGFALQAGNERKRRAV